MGFWETLRKDIKKGIDEGLEAFKEGTEVLKHKAGSVTEDIKNKVKAFELRQKIQVQLTELGGRVYEISSDKRKNPMRDEKVEKIVERIKKVQQQIDKLEKNETGKAAKKTGTSGRSRKKKTATRAAGETAGKAPKRSKE
ncbi:hypothetical protein BMS3Bbin06_02219 [bacterium BMS3Bbin06]|nr:hypothetical protein BMS3Abin08_01412 [bacterium BMS3Abin08]GBE35676.1 hypothetical protein BMS3Bbin06_02219 [bacterium BMS3Bbin06]HDO36921.1 hypothetical protein [Nitrospirota bacterium]